MFTSQAQVKTSLVMPLMQGGKPRTIKLSYSLMGRLSRSDKEPAFQFFKRYLTVLRYCTCCCSTPLGLSNALTLSHTHMHRGGERQTKAKVCYTKNTWNMHAHTHNISACQEAHVSQSVFITHPDRLENWKFHKQRSFD